MKNRDWLFIIIILSVVYFSVGCTTTPTSYGQYVEITSGPYCGYRGRLIGDCSGFEKYQVKLTEGKIVCIHSWEMEKV